MIVQAAQLAQDVVGDRGDVFRTGGEEFTCLVQGATSSEVRALAERLRRSFEDQAVRIDGHAIAVTVSIGIACGHARAGELAALEKLADDALYQAKRGGWNRMVVAEGRAMPHVERSRGHHGHVLSER